MIGSCHRLSALRSTDMNLPSGSWRAMPVAVFCLFLLAACNSDPNGSGQSNAGSAASLPARQSAPVPPSPTHVIRSEVFSFQTGMIGNANINMFVYTKGFGYSYWWAHGPQRSDELGRFEGQVPDSVVSIFAWKDGFVQPCGIRRDVTSDIEVRVEMLPVSAFDSVNPPRPH